MRHKTTEAVFQYFNHLRAGRAAPLRTEIDPAALKAELPDLFILEKSRDGVVRFRLAGTRVCLILGQEAREHEFGQIWDAGMQHRMRLAADAVLANQNALEVAVETVADFEDPIELEMLLLPLYSRENQCDRIFGSLVALQTGSPIQPYPRLLRPQDLAFVPVDAGKPVLRDPSPAIRGPASGSFGTLVNRVTHLRVFEGGRRD